MRKSELKNMIKECVKEVLFEEGVLSNLVAEVAFGITKAQSQILESSQHAASTNLSSAATKEQEQALQKEKRKKLLETKKKMLDAIGGGDKMKGVFEGTEPLPNTGNPHSPLSGISANDAGVDITGLFGLAGKKWQQLK